MHLLAFSPPRDTEPVLVKTVLVLPFITFAENCGGILSVLRGVFYDMSYKNSLHASISRLNCGSYSLRGASKGWSE